MVETVYCLGPGVSWTRNRNKWVVVLPALLVLELVEYVEEERSWRSAGLGTRIKWWIFDRDE